MKYYFADGDKKPVGPLPVEALRNLQIAGIISDCTLVIPEGGSEWERYSGLFPKAIPGGLADRIPPIPEVPPDAVPPRPFSPAGSSVPAAYASRVENHIVWIAAFLPLAYWTLDMFYKSLGIPTWLDVPICVGINSLFLSSDAKKLKAMGFHTKPLGSFWLLPIYLFKRTRIVGGENGYAICWLGTFFISLFLK
jgi:hypothetical protein